MGSRDDFMREKLNEFYKGSVPDYIVDAGKTHLTVRLQDGLFTERDYVITICSLHEYLNSVNDREEKDQLAAIKGDPQFIYNLAMECLRWFRFINPEQ